MDALTAVVNAQSETVQRAQAYGSKVPYEEVKRLLGIGLPTLFFLTWLGILKAVGDDYTSRDPLTAHSGFMREKGYVSELMPRVAEEKAISLATIRAFLNKHRNQLIAAGLMTSIAERAAEVKGKEVTRHLFVYPLSMEGELINALTLRQKYLQIAGEQNHTGGEGVYTIERVKARFGLSTYDYKALVTSGIVEVDRGKISEASMSRLEQLLTGKEVLKLGNIISQKKLSRAATQKRLDSLISAETVEPIGNYPAGTHFFVYNTDDRQTVLDTLTQRHRHRKRAGSASENGNSQPQSRPEESGVAVPYRKAMRQLGTLEGNLGQLTTPNSSTAATDTEPPIVPITPRPRTTTPQVEPPKRIPTPEPAGGAKVFDYAAFFYPVGYFSVGDKVTGKLLGEGTVVDVGSFEAGKPWGDGYTISVRTDAGPEKGKIKMWRVNVS